MMRIQRRNCMVLFNRPCLSKLMLLATNSLIKIQNISNTNFRSQRGVKSKLQGQVPRVFIFGRHHDSRGIRRPIHEKKGPWIPLEKFYEFWSSSNTSSWYRAVAPLLVGCKMQKSRNLYIIQLLVIATTVYLYIYIYTIAY